MALAPDSRWRLVDKIIACYGLVVAALALSRISQFGAWWMVLAHLLLPLLAWLSTRTSESLSGRFLRSAYPAILLIGLYSAIDVMNGFGAARVWDAPLQQIEAGVFGGQQPARDWWRAHPSVLWSTVLHAVYFSYYFIVPLPLIVFMVQRRPVAVVGYLNGLLSTYLCCYLFYLLLPVSGPYYHFAHPTGEFVANLPAQLVYQMLSKGSSYGAAFPSSHVAATVAASLGAWFYSRKLGALLAIPTALLVVGVVYCQMHYVIDSAAGLLVGIVVPLWVHVKTNSAGAIIRSRAG